MSRDGVAEDEAAIDALVAAFYGAFDNREGRTISVDALREMFLRQAIITRSGATGVEAMSVESFIEPRAKMLSDGTLTDFHEWESSARTILLRNIACRHSTYEKRGRYEDASYDVGGAKLIQLVRTDQGWRIAAIAWEDDL